MAACMDACQSLPCRLRASEKIFIHPTMARAQISHFTMFLRNTAGTTYMHPESDYHVCISNFVCMTSASRRSESSDGLGVIDSRQEFTIVLYTEDLIGDSMTVCVSNANATRSLQVLRRFSFTREQPLQIPCGLLINPSDYSPVSNHLFHQSLTTFICAQLKPRKTAHWRREYQKILDWVDCTVATFRFSLVRKLIFYSGPNFHAKQDRAHYF